MMKLQTKIIDLLNRTFEIERDLLGNLTEEDRATVGEPSHWSIKDQIAHCAAWNERLAKNISTALQGITPTREEDYEQVNKEIFEVNREKAWEEIIAYFERVHHELVDVIQSIPEISISEGEFLPWQSGRELWKLIIGTSYTHPMTHFSQIYLEKGNADEALKIQEEMAKSLSEMDESPSWLGVCQYNLACFYSLSGQSEKAIRGLKEALHLNPELTDWSRQDPDFDPIREQPDFRAIYDDE
jgi:tetratricopeptide (TPR) repeat protein